MIEQSNFPHDDPERAWLASLARESDAPPGAEDRMVQALRRDGLLARRFRLAPAMAELAAALLLFASGEWAGARLARRASLEGELARTNASPADRILTLQRAGSDYRLAMQRVADVAPRDSTAAEVTAHALTGAALAAARANLDDGLSPRLIAAVSQQASDTSRGATLIWY